MPQRIGVWLTVADTFMHAITSRADGAETMTYWGIVTVGIGLLMSFWGTTKSEFVVYRILRARAQLFWGETVHRFFQISGIAVSAMGLFMIFKHLGS